MKILFSVERRVIAALVLCMATFTSAQAVDTQISFRGTGGTVIGPQIVDDIVGASNLYDGMFVIRNFDARGFTGTVSFDGTTVSSTGGVITNPSQVEFLLHSQRLERLEAITTRTAASNTASDPLVNGQENKKILLPRTATYTDGQGTGFFGKGSVTFASGVLTGFDYEMGAGPLSTFDFVFAGAGITASLEKITLDAGGISLAHTLIAGGADASATTAFGQNSNGYTQGSTENDTTRAEATDPTLCTAKYVGGVCPADLDPYNAGIGLLPFAGGDLVLYDIAQVDAEITAVPVPAMAWLFGACVAGLLGRRKVVAA